MRTIPWSLLLALAACDRRAPKPPRRAPVVRPESRVESTRVAPPEPVDLVRALGLDLAVSSTVHNFTDVAWHLVDDDPSTAWNSRSGDLAGAWIDVRVPSGATVTSLRMTAGYTRTARDGRDLFAMNHRVSTVRVSRDGVSLGEFTLDPARRDAQTLAVHGDAGVYRVELVALTPGERLDWREASVSQLEVWGVAPCSAADAAVRAPVVHLGSLAGPDSARVFEARVAVRAARERRAHAADTAPDAVCPGPWEPGYFEARQEEADAVVALGRLVCDATPALARSLTAYDRAAGVELDLRPDYLLTVHPMYLGDPASRRAAYARGISQTRVTDALAARDRAVRAVIDACHPAIDQMRFPSDEKDDSIRDLAPVDSPDDDGARP